MARLKMTVSRCSLSAPIQKFPGCAWHSQSCARSSTSLKAIGCQPCELSESIINRYSPRVHQDTGTQRVEDSRHDQSGRAVGVVPAIDRSVGSTGAGEQDETDVVRTPSPMAIPKGVMQA